MLIRGKGITSELGSHPDELQLQSYLDGETSPELGQNLAGHLQQCPACQARVRAWEELSVAIRATRPTPEMFASEGEFWAGLAGHLSPERPATWPFLAYLPPVVLGVLGTFIDMLISMIFVFYALVSLGILPSVATAVRNWLPDVLMDPLLENSVSTWLGWSAREAVEGLLHRWETIGWQDQSAVLFAGALLLLSVLLAAVVVLYLSWAIYWPKNTSNNRESCNR